jgi:Cu/Zn superoxide dismutase
MRMFGSLTTFVAAQGLGLTRLHACSHVGDLGNVEANEAGIVTLNFTVSFLSLSGQYSIIGRGVVVRLCTSSRF